MFDESKDAKEQEKNKDEEINKKKRHEEELDKKIDRENSNSFGKKTFRNDETDFVMRKYSKLIDKEVLDDLYEMKRKRKITQEEFLEQIVREGRSNQRRLNRIQEREDKRVCFKCRKPGHAVSQCPEIDKDNEQGTGICYKCGSTEHSVKGCKVRLEAGNYPYAKCFICHEMGHLTKQCPDNPRGLYPNGGCCKSCGSVEHYYRDCPEVQKQNLQVETKTVKKLKSKDKNFEELSDDDSNSKKNTTNSSNKKKKTVFF